MRRSCILASWRPLDRDLLANASIAGAKAAGLMLLPQPWIPDFVVLGQFFSELLDGRPASQGVSLMTSGDIKLLDGFLAKLNRAHMRIYVRSNGSVEGIDRAGTHSSVAVPADLAELMGALDLVTDFTNRSPVFALLQGCIEPAVLGHMANERRVSRRANTWLVEANWQRAAELISESSAGGSLADVAQLGARSERQAVRRLREIAKFLTNGSSRYHLEWIWDHLTVHVVQVQPVLDESVRSRLDQSIDRVEPWRSHALPLEAPFRHWRDSQAGHWKKLDRPRTLASLGIPTADVYMLKGEDLVNDANAARMLVSLRKLCERPVVVRSDIAHDAERNDILLPTSDELSDPDELIRWMRVTLKNLTQSGLMQGQIAFLLANLVPATASAIAGAEPNHRQVVVDALWGYPDGLNYLPHDSYRVDLQTDAITARHSYKGYALDGVGGWSNVQIGPGHDWGGTLSKREVLTISRWARALADHLGSPVQLMVLARIGGHRGGDACLPWHFWTEHPQADVYTRTSVVPLGVAAVSNDHDLDQILANPPEVGILIRPDGEHSRDIEFLRRVSNSAKSIGLPLYFEGSLLGHPYYVMSSTGATVVPIGLPPPEDKPNVHDKLVRDRIPAIIQEAGGVARVRILGRGEAAVLLGQKLVEESFEVWASNGGTSVIEELADVLEVVDGLIAALNISRADLAAAKSAKRAERGGFEDHVYLEGTAVRPLELSSATATVDWTAVKRGTRARPREPVVVRTDRGTGATTIAIPAVPPVRGGTPVKTFKGMLGDQDLLVRFGGPFIEISIGQTEAEAVGEQLRLFQ